MAFESLTDKLQNVFKNLRSKGRLTEEDVNDFCLDLPKYKRPRKIIFSEVPRNPTGKIEKPVLRKLYCGESVVAQQNEIKQ